MVWTTSCLIICFCSQFSYNMLFNDFFLRKNTSSKTILHAIMARTIFIYIYSTRELRHCSMAFWVCRFLNITYVFFLIKAEVSVVYMSYHKWSKVLVGRYVGNHLDPRSIMNGGKKYNNQVEIVVAKDIYSLSKI